ncbi:MAG: HesB/IscA family protein [Myxococcaceae bacterium]
METALNTALDTTSDNPAAPTPIRLTPNAVNQVKTVMKSQGFDGHVLAVRVVPSGCNGFGYDLNLVKEAKSDDTSWEQDGIRIATDALSLQYLTGTEVDFVQEIQGAGFRFANPNAKGGCGCGQSFST